MVTTEVIQAVYVATAKDIKFMSAIEKGSTILKPVFISVVTSIYFIHSNYFSILKFFQEILSNGQGATCKSTRTTRESTRTTRELPVAVIIIHVFFPKM